ncbi:hypothetical protein NXW05_00875 [Phocaeicola vulgatus]|nr:hypothetical protein [Phocaeicola vulgatus]MCS3015857.1 hypothetical protein [Phocaeicola vulgatus]
MILIRTIIIFADAARNIDSRTKSYHAANKEFPGDDDEAEQMLST